MKNNFPTPDANEGIADGGRLRPLMELGPIYMTDADLREIRPELRSLSHARFLDEAGGSLVEAQQSGIPILLKELRAGPYFAWLKRHGLANDEPNRFLYSCFAPAVRDTAVLARLGVRAELGAKLERPKPDLEVTREMREKFEHRIVCLLRAGGCDNPLGMLKTFFRLTADARTPLQAELAWDLAERVMDGMPARCCFDAFTGAFDDE
jgi:hypothetical protein